MNELPDYRDLGRGFFIQSLIDLATILAWAGVGALLLMAIGSPFMFAFLLIYGG